MEKGHAESLNFATASEHFANLGEAGFVIGREWTYGVDVR
jgi:hypothetical protein